MPLFSFLKRKMDQNEVQMTHFPTQSNNCWPHKTRNQDSAFWKQTPFHKDLEIPINVWSNRVDISTHNFQYCWLNLPTNHTTFCQCPIFLNLWYNNSRFHNGQLYLLLFLGKICKGWNAQILSIHSWVLMHTYPLLKPSRYGKFS